MKPTIRPRPWTAVLLTAAMAAAPGTAGASGDWSFVVQAAFAGGQPNAAEITGYVDCGDEGPGVLSGTLTQRRGQVTVTETATRSFPAFVCPGSSRFTGIRFEPVAGKFVPGPATLEYTVEAWAWGSTESVPIVTARKSATIQVDLVSVSLLDRTWSPYGPNPR